MRSLPLDIYDLPLTSNEAERLLIGLNYYEVWEDVDGLCVKIYFSSSLAFKRRLEYLKWSRFQPYKIQVIYPGKVYYYRPLLPPFNGPWFESPLPGKPNWTDQGAHCTIQRSE